jgi:hypothetical protein
VREDEEIDNMRLFLLVILSAVCLSLSPLPARGASLHDGQHDFDFQFGAWKVSVQRLLHPLGPHATWVRYEGTHVVEKVWGGKANLGVLELQGPGGHVEGLSLRLYQPQAGQWSVIFINSSDGIAGNPSYGGFAHAVGRFYDQATIDGQAVYERTTTSDIQPNSYRDDIALSTDGGRHWKNVWIASYVRTASNPAVSSQPNESSTGGHQHDFDFEIGAWKAHVSRLRHPLTGSTAWVHYDGTSVVRGIWEGRANLGELDVSGPAGRITGLSLRTFDPRSGQWYVSWANSADGVFTQPLIGAFSSGRGEFYDQEMFNGKAIFTRFVFSGISAHSFRLEQAYSDDGGVSWETNWIAIFTR